MMFIEINDSLVGWNSVESLITLGNLAHEVKDGGWIIEASAMAGRASYALAANKQPNTTLTCFELFNDRPEHADPRCFGHISNHVNYFTFKKQIVEPFDNVEAVRADLPINSTCLAFTKKIDMIYFNNDHNPDVWEERVRSIMHLMADDGIIVAFNLHRLGDKINEIFPSDEYQKTYKHALCIIKKEHK